MIFRGLCVEACVNVKRGGSHPLDFRLAESATPLLRLIIALSDGTRVCGQLKLAGEQAARSEDGIQVQVRRRASREQAVPTSSTSSQKWGCPETLAKARY